LNKVMEMEQKIALEKDEQSRLKKKLNTREEKIILAVGVIDDFRVQLENAHEEVTIQKERDCELSARVTNLERQLNESYQNVDRIQSQSEEKVKGLEEERCRVNAINAEQQEKLTTADEELTKIRQERRVLLGEVEDFALIQVQLKNSNITTGDLEEVVQRKLKEIEAFKKNIEKLKQEEKRIVTEFTKNVNGFDINDFVKLITALVQKELVSIETITKQIELQKSIKTTTTKKTQSTSRTQIMPHQKRTSASPKQTLPTAKKNSLSSKQPTKNQSLTSRKELDTKKKSSTMVKNTS